MHYLSEAETKGAVAVQRPLRGREAAALRSSEPAARTSPTPVRARFNFDADYVRKLIAEDPETERHFTEYFGDLLTVKLRSRLRSAAQVDDVKQETFVRVLTALKRGGLASPQSLGAFVNSVCNNVLLETWRSAARTSPIDEQPVEPESDEPSAEWTVLKSEQRDQVREAIAGLPQRDKDLIRWLFFEDRAKDDVCRELNIDRNYLRVLFHRTKQRFRERLSAVEQQA
ncbi:MAG TPA: sigma-70 family RNA polymerase sigma factor [Vicinamibacterales bacterium]|nr:sigma-70 family RNA polymerase sigma factor [Vicinamibacterales bacterium]